VLHDNRPCYDPMPTTLDRDGEGRTVTVKAHDFADYLGVSENYLSRAVHNRWNAGGVDVELYAVWRTRNRSQVRHYEIPEKLARRIIPPSEQPKYDL